MFASASPPSFDLAADRWAANAALSAERARRRHTTRGRPSRTSTGRSRAPLRSRAMASRSAGAVTAPCGNLAVHTPRGRRMQCAQTQPLYAVCAQLVRREGVTSCASLACGADRWGIVSVDADEQSKAWLQQMVAATTAAFGLVRCGDGHSQRDVCGLCVRARRARTVLACLGVM